MQGISKLILPVTIILACLILGGFYYATEVNKQQSIERQQQVKMAEDKKTEEAKAEQAKKDYIAKRKMECYDIEQRERKLYTNVESSLYQEAQDICYVHYKTDQYKGVDCKKTYSYSSPEALDCELGLFTKQF